MTGPVAPLTSANGLGSNDPVIFWSVTYFDHFFLLSFCFRPLSIEHHTPQYIGGRLYVSIKIVAHLTKKITWDDQYTLKSSVPF